MPRPVPRLMKAGRYERNTSGRSRPGSLITRELGGKVLLEIVFMVNQFQGNLGL